MGASKVCTFGVNYPLQQGLSMPRLRNCGLMLKKLVYAGEALVEAMDHAQLIAKVAQKLCRSWAA
jgi:hypothetical protein